MKIKSLVIASALAGGLFVSASALTTVDASGRPAAAFEAPAPAAIVAPTDLPRSHLGATVTLRFTVDAAGHATDIKVVGERNATLSRSLQAAVSQWKFKPALRNGVPVTTKVELPLELQEG